MKIDFRRRAFTIVELLVVISVIALLMAVLLPSLDRAREMARRTVCATNLHQFHLAAAAYSTDYKQWLPSPPGPLWGNALSSGSVVSNTWREDPTLATGLWQLIHGPITAGLGDSNYINGPLRVGHCPDMELNAPYHNPTNYGSTEITYMIDYDYRFNTIDIPAYGVRPGGEYKVDSLNSAPSFCPLFNEATNYRCYNSGDGRGDCTPRPVTLTSAAYKWAHGEGGNVARMDGAVQWLSNQNNPTAALGDWYGNAMSWPGNGSIHMYYVFYPDKYYGLDAYMELR